VIALTSACERDPVPTAGATAPEPTEPLASRDADLPAAITRSRPAAAEPCPSDMVLVEGDYCPNVQLNCKRFLDPKGRYHEFRCAEYAPSTCKSAARKKLRFCIDRGEYVPPGETLPANHQSFRAAQSVCQSLGKRVCQESEWNFACEGEEMRPYPYGFQRDPDACNADRTDILTKSGKLRDLRAPPGAHPRCASPFGVLDLAGNLEEFVAIDGTRPLRPAMKGAYWQPSRNFCRAAQTAHDSGYHGTETGFRCCAEAK
jgi:formylglycine-generating enzyme